jgi:hypothetical protein
MTEPRITEEPDVIHVDITPDTSRITAALDRVAARLRFIRQTGLDPDAVAAHSARLGALADRIADGYPQRFVIGTDVPEPEDTHGGDAVTDTAPCAHCAIPQHTHGNRYAAIPGWHPWTAERSASPGPPPLWLPPVVGNQR